AMQNWERVQQMVTALDVRPVPPWLRDVLLPVLTRAEHAGTIRSLYLGLPLYATYSQSPQGFSTFMRSMAGSAPFDRVLVLTSLAPAARYPVDFIDPGLRQLGFDRVSTAQFKQGNTRIDVYRRGPS